MSRNRNRIYNPPLTPLGRLLLAWKAYLPRPRLELNARLLKEKHIDIQGFFNENVRSRDGVYQVIGLKATVGESAFDSTITTCWKTGKGTLNNIKNGKLK